MTYDRRTASEKPLHLYLRDAEAAFMKDVARIVSSRTNKIKATVRYGTRDAFLEFEGWDDSDFTFDGYIVNVIKDPEVLVVFEMKHAFKGKVKDESRFRVGAITPKLIADILIRNTLGSR